MDNIRKNMAAHLTSAVFANTSHPSTQISANAVFPLSTKTHPLLRNEWVKKPVNLERREEHCRIESEMKEFYESDHEDFVSLFKSAGKEELHVSEGMHLLWEAQADVL